MMKSKIWEKSKIILNKLRNKTPVIISCKKKNIKKNVILKHKTKIV